MGVGAGVVGDNDGSGVASRHIFLSHIQYSASLQSSLEIAGDVQLNVTPSSSKPMSTLVGSNVGEAVVGA